MLAVIAVPVVFGYAAVRYGARFLSAVRRGEAASFWQNEKRRLSFIGGVNLLFALLLAYGWLIEAKWVERVDAAIDLDVPGPIRIVHLSDLHAESFGERERRALDIVRSAEPDIIVLTGDYTSKRTGLAGTEHARRFVSELDAPSGIFAVPGNWDSSLGPLFEGTERPLPRGSHPRRSGSHPGLRSRDHAEPVLETLRVGTLPRRGYPARDASARKSGEC